MTQEDKPVPPWELLELDLSPDEAAQAQIPNQWTNLSSDATHPLTEAPAPGGVQLGSRPAEAPILTPILSREATDTSRPPQAPAFFQRLSLASSPAQIKIKRQSPQTYSLTAAGNWPVFLRRIPAGGPLPAKMLQSLASAARLGGSRLCLSPCNDLDIFFNDRRSLEQAARELADLPETKPLPVRFMACPGLYSCPLAAKDTLSAAGALRDLAVRRTWPKASGREPLIISLAGCPAGQGRQCGIYEYADLTLLGCRTQKPLLDQNLLAISPQISSLVSNCPAGALSRSLRLNVVLNLNPDKCRSCGACVRADPSFSWPRPLGSYFQLRTAGRRLGGPLPVYLAPRTVWDPLPADLVQAGELIFELIDLWILEAQAQEPLADFLERTGRLNYLAEKWTPPAEAAAPETVPASLAAPEQDESLPEDLPAEDQSSEVQSPEIQSPEVRTSEIKSSEIQSSEVQSSEDRKPEYVQPQIQALGEADEENSRPEDRLLENLALEKDQPEPNYPESPVLEMVRPENDPPESNYPESPALEKARPENELPEPNYQESPALEMIQPENDPPDSLSQEDLTIKKARPENELPGPNYQESPVLEMIRPENDPPDPNYQESPAPENARPENDPPEPLSQKDLTLKKAQPDNELPEPNYLESPVLEIVRPENELPEPLSLEDLDREKARPENEPPECKSPETKNWEFVWPEIKHPENQSLENPALDDGWIQKTAPPAPDQGEPSLKVQPSENLESERVQTGNELPLLQPEEDPAPAGSQPQEDRLRKTDSSE
ncbi:MAG: hypothetical protein LBK52_03955 [Deltaproteobacteria bacterium]|nr:hypothetical protein [Deltaproteobacteria bacterium]